MANQVTSGMAVASFVLGILSIFVGWIPFVGQIPSVLAIVFGFVGLNNLKKSENMSGRTLALWGIWLGAFWLALGIILIIIGAGWYVIQNITRVGI